MVTAREVARLAGVSQATVSRVLHNHSSVRPATRDRVLAALSSSGYQPNLAARAMRTRRTDTVGLVVDDVTNPFYPEMIQTISRELSHAQLRMVLWDSAGPGEQAAIDAIAQALIDGLIFTTATPKSKPLHEAIRRGAPVVLVNRTVAGLPCDQIEGDNYAKAADVAAYFARAGRRRVAMVGGPAGVSTADERMAGFTDGCQEHGLELAAQHVVNGHLAHNEGRAAMARILDAGRPSPTAVFCVNDMSALGALDELRSRGVSVPDDVWLVGYDDIALTAWESLSLSTVHQPTAEMAAAAVRLLMARIANPDAATSTQRFAGHFVPRRTTANTPWEDLHD